MMRKTCQAFAMVTCFGAFAACTDGEVGTNGRVRFSQSMAFADVEGLQAPIAVGRPLWITLQDAPANAHDEDVDNPRLALHVHRDGVLVHSPPRLNEVTHELVLDEPGSYELVAQLEAAELDRTSVRAAAVAGIGTARAYKTSTRAVEGGCLLHVSTGEGLSFCEAAPRVNSGARLSFQTPCFGCISSTHPAASRSRFILLFALSVASSARRRIGGFENRGAISLAAVLLPAKEKPALTRSSPILRGPKRCSFRSH